MTYECRYCGQPTHDPNEPCNTCQCLHNGVPMNATKRITPFIYKMTSFVNNDVLIRYVRTFDALDKKTLLPHVIELSKDYALRGQVHVECRLNDGVYGWCFGLTDGKVNGSVTGK